MTLAAISPKSVLASPIQVNPQVTSDLQTSTPQVAQNAQKAAKEVQTDTVTISSQALKMADDKYAIAQKAANKADNQQALQLARDKAESVRNQANKREPQNYASISAYF